VLLDAKGLYKRYGDLVAVNGIDFCVREGEIFGFLEPNGAGKTTTVRMFCGLTKIASGDAYIDGHSVRLEGKKVKKIIGVVPDISNLYSELTCLENPLFSGEMYGIPKRERLEKAEELLRPLGLWERRNTKFKNLSKGLKRRLTLAATLKLIRSKIP
jgi:ABC-2 type transport system ATP-binding protein